MMVDRRVMDIGELKALLTSSEVFTFQGASREEIYAWIERTLRSCKYRSRPRLEKGVLRRYMRRIALSHTSEVRRHTRAYAHLAT